MICHDNDNPLGWGILFSPTQSGLFAGKPGRGSGQFSMCIRFSNWAYLIYLHIFEHGDFPASVHISTVTLLILPGPPTSWDFPHWSPARVASHDLATPWLHKLGGWRWESGTSPKTMEGWVVYCQQEWGYKTSQNESVLWEEALRGSKTLHVSLTQWPNIDQLWLTWCRILRSLLKAGTGTADSPKFRLAFVWFTGRDG